MKVFCIDIGGTGIKYCIFNDGVQSSISTIPTPKEMSTESMTEVIFSLLDKESCFDFVSISTAGQMRDNTVIQSTSKPKYIGCNWAKIIKERYGVEAIANNDLHAAVMGEYHFGLENKPKNFVTVAIGTGINIGLVVNGDIFTGDTNLCSYFDHVTDLDGITNFREASTKSLLDMYRDITERDITGEELVSLLYAKDTVAIEVYESWVDKVAHFLKNVVYIFDIRTITLCGGILNASYDIYGDIKRRFFEVTVPTYSDNVVINKSCLSSSQLFGAYAYAKKYIGD